MNLTQAAAYFGVTPTTVFRYIRERGLPCEKVQDVGLRPRLVFDKAAVDAWLEVEVAKATRKNLTP